MHMVTTRDLAIINDFVRAVMENEEYKNNGLMLKINQQDTTVQ